MSTSRPFAYNTGSTIAGTEQVGNLAIGVPTNGFESTGIQWWNGPDEDLGYVIAYPQSGGTQPTPYGGQGYVQFWRTKTITDQEFIALCNSVIKTQNFTDVTTAKNYLNSNGYWTSFVNVTPTPTPTQTLTPTITPTKTITPTPSITPTNTITPSITPTNTPTPSTTPPASSAVTFSQTFTSGQSAGATIENAWTTFRGQLTGSYTQFVWSSTNGSSITVTDGVKVQQIANALRTGTTGTNFTTTIGANTWRVAQNCSATTPIPAQAIEFTNDGLCSCGGAGKYTMRPFIRNLNWGGTNQSTCGAATQTITITFT